MLMGFSVFLCFQKFCSGSLSRETPLGDNMSVCLSAIQDFNFRPPVISRCNVVRNNSIMQGLYFDSSSVCQRIPDFYGTRQFIPVFMKVHHQILSSGSYIKFTSSYTVSLTLFILPPRVSLVWPLPFNILTKLLYAFLIFFMRATCATGLTLIPFITLLTFGE